MPRRPAIQQLARLLESSPLPIYALDGERRIVFCNPACAAWVGLSVDELLGLECVYASAEALAADGSGAAIQSVSAEPSGAAAARLCPPPAALAGQRVTATISSLPGGIFADRNPSGSNTHDNVTTGSRLVFRQAEFLPLEPTDPDSHGAVPVLVIASAHDLPPGESVDPTAPAGSLSASSDQSAAELHDELARLRLRWAGRFAPRLLGSSPAAGRTRAQIALAAAAPANVLIVGPPGSGKEHVAGAIHFARPEATRDLVRPDPAAGLVPIACALLDPELLLSTVDALCREAQRSHDAARGQARLGQGALLLRDVDHVPPEVQTELYRLLRAAPALRVIATTTASLTDAARAVPFRADLAALLSTLVIELMPLAARIEDLPLLAQHFIEELNAVGGRQLAGFAPEALDQLAAYAWPGNLDELAQVAAEVHRTAHGPEITPRDLPRRILIDRANALRPPRSLQSIDLVQVLAELETELIRRALAAAKRNKSRAAELLGLTRPKLYRRLVQLGLEDPLAELPVEDPPLPDLPLADDHDLPHADDADH